MDAIYWGKAIIAREPSNEHDPYAVAVLEIPALGQAHDKDTIYMQARNNNTRSF